MLGTVRKFDKGYGFITPDDQSLARDVFVHHSEIQMDGWRALEVGQRVEFDVQRTEKGLQAENVEIIG